MRISIQGRFIFLEKYRRTLFDPPTIRFNYCSIRFLILFEGHHKQQVISYSIQDDKNRHLLHR